MAVGIPDVNPFAANRYGIRLAKRTPQDGRTKLLLGGNRSGHRRIIRGSWDAGGMYGLGGHDKIVDHASAQIVIEPQRGPQHRAYPRRKTRGWGSLFSDAARVGQPPACQPQ